MVGLDIRRPRLAELFGINDHKHGITNLLVKDNPTIEDIYEQILPSGVNKNLDLLMAGPIPPNPAELIARNSLDIIINLLKEKYDYIMIDTAPVGLVTDTLQIARVANASIYMCRADYTPKSSFNLINALANEKKFPNMAIVLNGIDMSKRNIAIIMAMAVMASMVDMVEQATVQAMDSMETMAIMVTMLTATMAISTMTL